MRRSTIMRNFSQRGRTSLLRGSRLQPASMCWLASLQGAAQTAAGILRTDGIRGLYRGFGTVIFGTIPARGVRPRTKRQMPKMGKFIWLRSSTKMHTRKPFSCRPC